MNTHEGDRLLGAVAAELRAQKAVVGITLDELVEVTGISKSALGRYLKGTRDIPLSSLAVMAEALGVTALSIIAKAQERLSE